MPTQSELRAFTTVFRRKVLRSSTRAGLTSPKIQLEQILAKAAIAIANEGGGIIVLGMREDIANGGALRSVPRPDGLNRYSLDDVNSPSQRGFAEPEFHNELVFLAHPTSGHEHAFVIVPGGMTVPVMSKRGCEGVIAAQRCFVRKPQA